MTKKQRMQLKGLICVLAILLLLLLLAGRLLLETARREPPKEETTERPAVVEERKNVWIMEETKGSVTVFADGTTERYLKNLTGEIREEGEDTGEKEQEKEEAGEEETEESGETRPERRDEIADLVLTDGVVTQICVKDKKVHAAVRRVGENFVELEGLGKLELSGDYRGYRFYGAPAMKSAAELVIGYDFADFVLDETGICAILFTGEGSMETIRVLLKNSNYEGLFHERLQIICDTDFTATAEAGGEERQLFFPAGEELLVCAGKKTGEMELRGSGGEVLTFDGESRITIVPAILTGKLYINNLERNCKDCGYRGSLEIRAVQEGLVLINSLPLEEYLYSVVPSEMPASYPAEALRAQAVCARTYAYGRMQCAGYPLYGAHLDDSTSYQVYHNLEEQAAATDAVKKTFGVILRTAAGETAETFYYSTSCGRGTDAKVWKTETAQRIDYLTGRRICRSGSAGEDGQEEQEFSVDTGSLWWYTLMEGNKEGLSLPDLRFLPEADSADQEDRRDENLFGAEFLLTRDEADFEADQGWYRWIYQVRGIDAAGLRGRLLANSPKDTVGEFHRVTALAVTKRGAGGVADELRIETDGGSYTVSGEYAIREVLCDGVSSAVLQSGKSAACAKLLPSAFFILLPESGESPEGYTLIGGGYGHGVGMSQNGAKEMALEGWTAEEILTFFYGDCTAEEVY